jgi:DNA-binding CsgD family transcriptional regulator
VPGELAGSDAVAPALELVGRELEPLVASFFSVGADGEIQTSVVHGSHLPPAELARQVRRWKLRLRGLDPLAPANIPATAGRLATLGDAGGRRPLGIYEELGVVNDARLLIRDGARVVAGVTLWRPLRSDPWSDSQLRRLATLQPLIEMAYLSSVRSLSSIDSRLPATFTDRQRQVARLLASGASNPEIARALYVSPNTAKSHARAVLSKLGVRSRREMIRRFTRRADG